MERKKTPQLNIEFDRETDGRWIAKVRHLPGALAYGKTKTEACRRAAALVE